MTALTDTTLPAPALTAKQVEQFHHDGFLGPFALCSPEEMDRLRPAIEQVLATESCCDRNRHHNRHLDSPLVHDLCASPQIVERMACVFGPDLLLWRSNFFIKEPGAREIPWHQDFNYWPIEPSVVASAWLAIDAATVENSCVQLVPGSHRKVLKHVKADPEMLFAEMADPDAVRTDGVVDMELKPGEFFLFNERTLHHSEPNRSQKRRIGLAVRVIPPFVRVLKTDSPQHRMVVLRGEDRMGFNELADKPAT